MILLIQSMITCVNNNEVQQVHQNERFWKSLILMNKRQPFVVHVREKQCAHGMNS